MNRIKWIPIAVMLLLPGALCNSQQVVEVNKGQSINAGPRLEFFVDSSRSLDLSKAMQQQFHSYTNQILNLGNLPFAVWVRFTVRTETEENVYLEIDSPLMETLNLYETGPGGSLTLYEGGFLKPFYTRPMPAENFLFSIDMQKGVAKTFYIKAGSGFPMMLPITVSSKDQFTAQHQRHNMFWGLYVGVILFAFLYNMFIYFSVREKTYLLYILYVLGSSTFYLGLQGFAFKFGWPTVPYLNTQLPVLICITNIIITLFTMEFLQITKKKKGLFYFGWGLIILYALIALLNIGYSYAIAAGLAQMLSLVTCIYFIYAAVRRYIQGVRTAKYYLIGWTLFLVLVMIYILTINNVIPGNFFTTHSIFIGHMTEVLLISFALADRINQLKKENEQKQEQIISQLEENEKLQLKVNRELEQKVKERTAEVVEQKNEAERQRNRSDELLLNILPAETAEELKVTGTAKAKHINEVTVLFSDIKNFTSLTENLSPAELVADINECFSAFDRIMEKNGVEKIKTIGDAYMAAGGLPNPNETHALDVVRAGLEIQEFMESFRKKRSAEGKRPFEIRVGIHTGPVVAGIVGIKKFAYDIWGDTVNLANRMEQSGEPGKVNISESSYKLVKDQFLCTHRGKIEAKHKGLIDMYFVEKKVHEPVLTEKN